ncbi:hypothetical protein Mapa_003374 [Marchantia paleacea]|nr:hypothetical protein Mapa_003374 [Marchantia paleacea]
MARRMAQLICRPYSTIQIFGTKQFLSGLHNHLTVSCGGYSAQSKLCLELAHHVLSVRRERTNTTRIYAGKPGFGAQPKKKLKRTDRPQQEKEAKDFVLEAQKILAKKHEGSKETTTTIEEPVGAPSLLIAEDKPTNALDEGDFERKLAEIKRLAEEQKKLDEAKKYGAIDYDAPVPASPTGMADNLFVKFGIGLAVIIFGLLFALGDNVPSFSPKAEKSGLVEKMQLKPDDRVKLQAQVKNLEEALQKNPEDRFALEGAGVIYAQLGDFDKAAELLSKIVQKSPRDVEALRLLAEVEDGKGDFDASTVAYRAAMRASSKESMALLQGLTDTLLAAKKPGEAVGELLAARTRLKTNAQQEVLPPNADDNIQGLNPQNYEQIDPIQVELLLGRSYAAWGKPGDAVSVYDGLITSYPDDFRGYLAKGVLLKDQGKTADSERMFIQARYLAPPEAKGMVDKYSGREAMAS